MRTIVAGYHNMGCEGLEALIRNGYDVVAPLWLLPPCLANLL